jgi:hypothetical protein
VAFDQNFVTLGAARAFPLAYPSGKIAGVDVTEAGFAADFDGAQ